MGTSGAETPSFVEASTFIRAGDVGAIGKVGADIVGAGTGSAASAAGVSPGAGSGVAPCEPADVPAAFGSSAFSTRLGSATLSTRCCAVLVDTSALVASCFTTMIAPIKTAAIARNRRPRRRAEGMLIMAPGGTDTELGFWAGVSSLLFCRRRPPAGVELRTRVPVLEVDAAPGEVLVRPSASPEEAP
jgi:hypothetical protein